MGRKSGNKQEEVGGVTDRVTSTWQLPACYEMFWVSLGGPILPFFILAIHVFLTLLVRTQFVAPKAVWGLNQCLLYSQNPKCYNIVNECSYRISPDLKSNLAPTEIYTVC